MFFIYFHKINHVLVINKSQKLWNEWKWWSPVFKLIEWYGNLIKILINKYLFKNFRKCIKNVWWTKLQPSLRNCFILRSFWCIVSLIGIKLLFKTHLSCCMSGLWKNRIRLKLLLRIFLKTLLKLFLDKIIKVIIMESKNRLLFMNICRKSIRKLYKNGRSKYKK